MPAHSTWDGKEYVTVYFEPLFCKKEINPSPSRDPGGVVWYFECDEDHSPIRRLFSDVKKLEERLAKVELEAEDR